MSDYRLEFSSVAGPGDTDRLYDLLSVISDDDELKIIIDKDDREQAHTVIRVLEGNSFQVSTLEDGVQFHITARRISGEGKL